MTALAEFLFPAPAERRTGAIWAWWERRRLAYNVWVGTAGAFSMATGMVLSLLGPDGFDPVQPGMIWQPVLAFGLLANVCYSSGWVIEAVANKVFGRGLLPIGPALYRMGLTFSVGLALLPAMVFVIGWVLTIVFGNV